MTPEVVKSVAVLTGGVSILVGCLVATGRIRGARRTHSRVGARLNPTEDWRAWYVGGFSGLALGTRWLLAALTWLAWVVAGTALVVLGIRV